MVQFLRYCAVGLANTATTLAVIAVCLAVGWTDYPANVLGYAAGLALSFFANRRFTFDRAGLPQWQEARGFVAAFVIAYAVNLAVISLGRSLGLSGNPLLHLGGMAAYSLAFFVALKQLAFAGHDQGKSDWHHWTPLLVLGAFAGASLFVLVDNPLTHDVVWQFWVARQMLSGASLYRDIWEVNPPLWFWSAMPLEALAGLAGVSPFRYLNALIVGAATVSASSVLRLSGLSLRAGTWLACVTFALAIWIEPFDFGQREQLALIGALPYAAMVASRRQGHPVTLSFSVILGLLAAYGFALKHYFALVPVLLEVWLFIGLRKREMRYSPFRPETLVLAAAALLYLVAVLTFAPDFLRTTVPMVSLAYGGYEEPISKWFDEPAQLVWGLALISLLYSHRAKGRTQPLEAAFLLVALAFAAAYFLQAKGWQYHAMPVSAALLLALAVRMIDEVGARRVLLAVPIVAGLLLGQIHGHYRNYLRPGDESLVQSAPRGSAIAVFSADPMWAWPTIEENGYVWPLNLYSHWMLPTIGRAEVTGTLTQEMQGLADQVRLQAVHDMQCTPPALILFERRPRYPLQPKSFDVTGFFQREPAFSRFLAEEYRERPATLEFRVFERNRPLGSTEKSCRAIAAPRWKVERRDVLGRRISQAT